MTAGASDDRGAANPLVPVLIGVVLVVGGGYLYYSGMEATANAEEVDATVVSSELVDTRRSGAPASTKDFTARVEYRYTYDGQTYTSEALCPGDGTECAPSSDFRTDIRDFLEDYPEGETVTAYVQPSNPSESYLIPGEPSLMYLGVAGIGALLTVLGGRRLLGE